MSNTNHIILEDISYSNIVDLLLERNIVSIFQGRTEAGPRALGNRSILYDPTDPNARKIVNSAKKREWWRPFAASILLEDSHDWFDMGPIKESPYMMYAIPVREEKKKYIPGVLHIDDTCRIQTVTEEQNYHYYNLIKEFKNRTGIPLLFNTSLNLAGEVICHNAIDAISSLEISSLEYLYNPETKKIVYVKN